MKRHISTQESKIQVLGSTETVKNATVCRLRKTTMLRKHMPHYATLCHISRVQVGLGCEAVAEGLRCHVAKGSGGRPSSRAQHRGAEIHQVDLGGPRRELRGDV